MKIPWNMPQKKRLRLFIPTVIIWIIALICVNFIKEGWSITFAVIATIWFQMVAIFFIQDNHRQSKIWLDDMLNNQYPMPDYPVDAEVDDETNEHSHVKY